MWRRKIMHEALLGHLSKLICERHPVSTPAILRQTRDYLADQFRTLGLDVSLHPFRALNGRYENVIGTRRPGKDVSKQKPPLIIAAHYDTVKGSPGADDNASGLAVMLGAAQALAGMELTRELRFIGFCLEEQDLLGSSAYAASLRNAGEEILGAIVLECVGYTSQKEGSQTAPVATPIKVPRVGDFLGVVGNVSSALLVKSFEEAASRAAMHLKTVSLVVPAQGERLPDTRRSDHAAFWYYGYPALMLTDTANFRNPHYHQPTDTLETLDLMFMQHVMQGVIATAIKLCATAP
jgi:Zn-dependent M28 family amino/carboxypeptidase